MEMLQRRCRWHAKRIQNRKDNAKTYMEPKANRTRRTYTGNDQEVTLPANTWGVLGRIDAEVYAQEEPLRA
jgi:hypothetical protein